MIKSSSLENTEVRHPFTRTPEPQSSHLANSTVPCSRGLRLTTRQLCRISSDSRRSMLSLPGKSGNRHSDGTLEAWAPSTQMQRYLLGDAGEPPPHSRPSALVGWGPATAPLLVQPRGCSRPAWPRAVPGDPACCALHPEAPREPPIKATVAPTHSGPGRLAHSLCTRLRKVLPEVWEMSRLQSLTEIAEPLGLFSF